MTMDTDKQLSRGLPRIAVYGMRGLIVVGLTLVLTATRVSSTVRRYRDSLQDSANQAWVRSRTLVSRWS